MSMGATWTLSSFPSRSSPSHSALVKLADSLMSFRSNRPSLSMKRRRSQSWQRKFASRRGLKTMASPLPPQSLTPVPQPKSQLAQSRSGAAPSWLLKLMSSSSSPSVLLRRRSSEADRLHLDAPVRLPYPFSASALYLWPRSQLSNHSLPEILLPIMEKNTHDVNKERM